MLDPSSFSTPSSKIAQQPFTRLRKAELRTLSRLASKTNVLPVIGRIDSLTEDELEAVKEAVNQEIRVNLAGGWGVFDPQKPAEVRESSEKMVSRKVPGTNGNTRASDSEPESPISSEESGADGSPVKVIKIRSTRRPPIPTSEIASPTSTSQFDPGSTLRRSRSRSRLRRAQSHAHASDEEFDVARSHQDIADTISISDAGKRTSIASRFSVYTHGGKDSLVDGQRGVEHLLPFGLVNPSPVHFSPVEGKGSASTPFMNLLSALSPSGLPISPNGIGELFTRKYKWGTIDVLNPDHCDFIPMRAAIFGWGMKVRA